MMRERTSVDWTFVPIQWSDDGAASCGKRLPSARKVSKSYGAITGASSATSTNASVIPAPIHNIARAMPRASVTGASARRMPPRRRGARGTAGSAVVAISAPSSDVPTSLVREEQARPGRREFRYLNASGRPRTTHGAAHRAPGTWRAWQEGSRLVPDPRVDVRVDEVDDQARDHDHEGEDDDDPLHRCVV